MIKKKFLKFEYTFIDFMNSYFYLLIELFIKSLFKYFGIPTTILNNFKNIYEIVHQILFAIICFNRNQARFTDIRVGPL